MQTPMKFSRAGLLTSAATGLAMMCAGAGPVYAQDSDGASEGRMTMDAVIVTTERREQNLQDVAATVQAFSFEDLLQQGVNSNFENLQYVVPGLQIANQEGKVEVFLRGIGSTDSDFSSDPSIATHYNGVYLARPRGIGPLFFDVERVEVNKGPQGTLRGRNAAGGTINIISNKPDLEEFGGYLMVGAGNFDGREFEGVVNIPINDQLGVRGSLWSKKHDGLYTNEFGGGDDFETPSSQDDVAGRIAIRWQPNDRFTADVTYSGAEVNSSGDPGAFSGRALSAGETIEDLDDPWNQYFRTEGDFLGEYDTFLTTLTYNFDTFGVEYQGAFNSVDAYNRNASREWQLGQVYPGSEAEAAFIASGVNPQRNLLVNDTFHQAENSEATSHEIRYFSDWNRHQLTAGVFYFQEDYDFLSWDIGNGFCGNSDFLGADAPLGPNTFSCWQNGLGGEDRADDSEIETLAFYADGTYDVTDDFRVKAGLRFTDEEKTQNSSNAQYQFNFNADLFNASFNEPSDLIIGEPGFRLTDPGGRSIRLDTITPGDPIGIDYFFDGVASFGLGDTWGTFLASCQEPANDGLCEVIITSSHDDAGTADVTELTATNQVSDDYVNWRIGAEYDLTEDNLLYATISTGTRSGGVNVPLRVSTDLGGGVFENQQLDIIWDSETVTSYEIGSKNVFDFNGTPVRLNAAAFYYDYSDKIQQFLVDVPSPTPLNPDATTQEVITDNIGDAAVWGIEFEADVNLPYGFSAGGHLLLMDSEFDDTNVRDPRTGIGPNSDGTVVGVNLNGNKLQNTSDVNLNLRLSQTIDIDWTQIPSLSSFDWTVSMVYRSEYFLSPFNNQGYIREADGSVSTVALENVTATPNNNGAIANCAGCGGDATPLFWRDDIDGFALFNLNAGLNFGDEEQFRLDGYVENVFEEAFSTKGFINDSVNIRYLNSPRIYGLRLRAQF
ncbi:MAG: TonB-dependent receptor [Pseudomonadota bacterium]